MTSVEPYKQLLALELKKVHDHNSCCEPPTTDDYWGIYHGDRWWLPPGYDTIRFEGVGTLYAIMRSGHAQETVERHNARWKALL